MVCSCLGIADVTLKVAHLFAAKWVGVKIQIKKNKKKQHKIFIFFVSSASSTTKDTVTQEAKHIMDPFSVCKDCQNF